MNAANKFLNLIVYFIYPLFIIWPKLKYLENVLKDKNKLLICGKNFGCYKPTPLKMNLVLEIQMVQRDWDSQFSDLPLFPKLPHPQSVCSTEPCTFLLSCSL